MFSIFLPFASCEFKRYIDIEFLRVRQITALKYAVCAINIVPSDQIVEIWLLEMSDSIETGIVSVSNDDCLVFRMISFHHIIQSRVFIINIAWMNHTVNKATVKGIKKETDMILAEGTGITAIRNKGIRIDQMDRGEYQNQNHPLQWYHIHENDEWMENSH